ncbi:ABC transporter permease, partial [Arcobacter sp. HD9-500m-PIT-SAG02]
PFKVSGILKPTHTPIDKTLIVTLHAMAAIHDDSHKHFMFIPQQHNVHHEDGEHQDENHENEHNEREESHGDEHHEHENTQNSASTFKENLSHKVAKKLKILPEKISAVYVGMDSKSAIFNIQRKINSNTQEPLSAIIPALAVQDLWNFFEIVQITLNIISILVVFIGLLGMLSLILMGVQNRKKEMAILRSIGATPFDIAKLIVGEAAIVCGVSIGFGVVLLYVVLFICSQPLYDTYGFYLELQFLSLQEFAILALIECSAIIISFIPAYQIYKQSLIDGMNRHI